MNPTESVPTVGAKHPANRNLAAEQRAVEEGHRAFVQPDGSVEVVSDTHDGKRYRVTFTDTGDGIQFKCRPTGAHAFDDDHLETSAVPGVAPCKHAALAARRLERDGLAVLAPDGRWLSLVAKHEHAWVDGRCACGEPEDPFAGLPS